MLILLFAHVIIAVSGLIVAAAALYTLSEKAIQSSYVLTAGTIATGTVLVFSAGNLLKGCLSGLMYLSAVLVMTGIAKHQLAAKKIDR